MKRLFDDEDYGAASRWAVAALFCGALAVFSANVAGFMPDQILNGLNATRTQGGSLNQMRLELAALRQENARLENQYRTLVTRVNLLGDDSGTVIRRLAAVEKSLPALIESLPLASDIDRSILTGAITSAGGEVYTVEGGEVAVRYSPLFSGALGEESQPLPSAVPQEHIPVIEVREEPLPVAAAVPVAQSIAVGGTVSPAEAQDAYRAVLAKAGPLLLGTAPLLAPEGENGLTRVLLGPLPDPASAQALCARLMRLDVACEPAPYEGQALPF